MQLYNRAVYFRDGKAVGAGFCRVPDGSTMKVMALPSEHYDYLGPIDVLGKTPEEILKEVRVIPVK